MGLSVGGLTAMASPFTLTALTVEGALPWGWRLLCEPEARNTSTKGAWCKGSEFLGPCQEMEGIFSTAEPPPT